MSLENRLCSKLHKTPNLKKKKINVKTFKNNPIKLGIKIKQYPNIFTIGKMKGLERNQNLNYKVENNEKEITQFQNSMVQQQPNSKENL